MDFHPPQGAHTSHLRTLSKIKSLRDFLDPAPEDLSSEGAAYHTTNSRTVNTSDVKISRRIEVEKPGKSSSPRSRFGWASKGRASYPGAMGL
jgi:hypothetical protein